MLASTNEGEWTLPWPAVLRWDAPRSRATLVLDPFTRGATSGVLDPWTVTWNRRFSGALEKEPRAERSQYGFLCLEPDGWMVRIPAPEHRKDGRATGSRIGSLDLPPPTQDPGDSRKGRGAGS